MSQEVRTVQLSIKSGPGGYAALFVALGVAGLAIGWLAPDLTPAPARPRS
jgi:hypothetical protein